MISPLASMFFVAFLSATLLPGSSEILLVSLLRVGKTSPDVTILVATVGNALGSCVNWSIGRFLSHLRDRWWFPVKPDKFDRCAAWFRRYGIWSLLLSWVPLLGDPLTVIAGAARIPFLLFTGIVFVAKGGRYLIVAGMIDVIL